MTAVALTAAERRVLDLACAAGRAWTPYAAWSTRRRLAAYVLRRLGLLEMQRSARGHDQLRLTAAGRRFYESEARRQLQQEAGDAT